MTRLLRNERWLLLLGSALSLWLAVAMPVFAQESYYWSYAQHPDLSYFDHPPMVAWLIWLSTHLLGDGPLGIRLGSWLCGTVVVLTGLRLLGEWGASPRARRIWLLFGLAVPTAVATRFLTNPDPALCCFWMLTILALWKARSGSLRWWVLAGFAAGCALLSKYTAGFLVVGGAVLLCVDPALRRQIRRPGPWLGVLVATLTFLPVMWWNWSNDFVSFRFQTAGRWQHAHFGLQWLGELVGGQLLVLTPVVAVMVPVAAVWLWRRSGRSDVRATWILAFGLPLLVFMIANSLFVQVKINWLAPAILPLLLGTAIWWDESGATAWRPQWARRIQWALVGASLLMTAGPLIVFFPQHRGTTWTGWEEIAARAEHWEHVIDDPDGLEGNVFFFAGDYRDAAQLARSLKICTAVAEPGEVVEPTMAQNVVGMRALQFDHWDPPAQRIGQDAIFVLPRPEVRSTFLEMVTRHFRSIELVERVSIRRLGIELLHADIYICRHYFGPEAI